MLWCELHDIKTGDGLRGEGKPERCTVRKTKGLEDESCEGCETQTDAEIDKGGTGQERDKERNKERTDVSYKQSAM